MSKLIRLNEDDVQVRGFELDRISESDGQIFNLYWRKSEKTFIIMEACDMWFARRMSIAEIRKLAAELNHAADEAEQGKLVDGRQA